MKTQSRHTQAGFTVIELVVAIVVLIVASLLFFSQNNELRSAKLDAQRKTAINAIYYDLENVYYPKHGSYPQEVTEGNLVAVDPDLLTDTNGNKINDKLDLSGLDDATKQSLQDTDTHLSEYIYEPTNCKTDGTCKGYTLRTTLSNESDYIKKSKHN